MEKDFTARVGELGMYSYERPAYVFWSAFMNGLIAQGFTQAEAEQWLKSKAARWMLDGDMSERIEKLAFDFANSKEATNYASKKDCATWARKTA